MTANIGYVYLLAGSAPGVERKIRDQADAVARLGIGDFEICVIGPNRPSDPGNTRFVHRPRRSISDSVQYGLARFRIIEEILEASGYDLVCLRYPMADRHAQAVADRFHPVSEHHTKEVEERRAVLATRLLPLQRLHKHASLRWEERHGPPYLAKCRGIIAVTDEIRKYELNRARRELPSLTLPNGVAVDRVPHTRFKPFDGRTLNLVFLGGRDSPWHGTDRLIRSLSTHRGTTMIRVNLVGDPRPLPHLPTLPGTVEIERHGRLVGPELDSLMAEMNLAVSSLCLFRNGFNEGSPLKTREFIARGIPVLLAYEDPDLAGAREATPFVLPVPNDDSLIDPDAILEFASVVTRLERDQGISDQMRAYAREWLDWGSKMERMVRFLRSLPA